MNEYQEAIKRVELDFEDRIEEDNILMVGRVDVDALQELVDKATPTKPKIVKLLGVDITTCAGCGVEIMKKKSIFHHSKYCGNCGQAIDWSEE